MLFWIYSFFEIFLGVMFIYVFFQIVIMSLPLKVFAIFLLGLGLLIFADYVQWYVAPFDVLLFGSIGVIVFQTINFVLVRSVHGHVTIMNVVAPVVFCIPAVWYLGAFFMGISTPELLPVVIGVVLVFESVYALH